MPRAISPGPAGLKFWRAPRLSADNTADINNLPAAIGNQFNPWGPRRPVQDWVRANLCLYPPTESVAFPADAGTYALTGSNAALTVPVIDTTNLPAGIADSFNPWGPKRPVQDWLKGAIPAVPVTFTADSGSYTLTGTAAAMAFGYVAGSGSYSVTGASVALALGHVAGAGSYSLTGTAAGLTVAVNYAAAAGSYTITGAAASFVIPGGLVAASGSYTLTGADAAFVIPGVVTYLPAGMVGGYVPWGRQYPIVLRTSAGHMPSAVAPVTLTAAAGSYTITGSAAGLTVGSPADTANLPAGMVGGYVPWRRPYPVSLLTRTGRPLAAAPLTLTADAGSYTITGSSALLTVGGPTTLAAVAGSYAITGTSALLTVGAPPDVGNMPAGATVWFNPWRRPYPIALLTRTGRPLAVGPLTLTAADGSYTTTGSSAALALGLTANSGAYTVSGSAAVLAHGFAAGAGAYAITGTDAQIVQAGTITLTAAAGAYLITGSAATLTVSITPPVEVTPPPSGGAGFRVGRYKQFKLKKKRKHDQCEELLEYLRSLPPAEAEAAVAELPPRYLSLLDGLPLPHALVLPPARPQDDDDEDECALLLQMLLS